MKQLIILAGGKGTRLKDRLGDLPKPMIPIAGKPLLEHQVELAKKYGFNDLIFFVHYRSDMIEKHFGDGKKFGVQIKYILETEPLGTAGAVLAGFESLADRFLVMYGDSWLDTPYAPVVEAFRASGQPALMTVFRNEGKWDAANIVFAGGRIVVYDKVRRDSAMRHIDYGLGAFRATAFAPRGLAPGEGTAFDLASVYQELLAAGNLAGFDVGGRFYEIGSPAGLEETREYLSARGNITQ